MITLLSIVYATMQQLESEGYALIEVGLTKKQFAVFATQLSNKQRFLDVDRNGVPTAFGRVRIMCVDDSVITPTFKVMNE